MGRRLHRIADALRLTQGMTSMVQRNESLGNEELPAMRVLARSKVDNLLAKRNGRNFLVVPAGLGIDADGNHVPSEAYQALLDFILSCNPTEDDVIWLTSGNPFGAKNEDGSDRFEQDVAKAFLEKHGVKAKIIAIDSPDDNYSDPRNYLSTRENATLLLDAMAVDEELKEAWAEGNTIVVANDLHAARSWYLFDKELSETPYAPDGIVCIGPNGTITRPMYPRMVTDLPQYETRSGHLKYERTMLAMSFLGLDQYKWVRTLGFWARRRNQ